MLAGAPRTGKSALARLFLDTATLAPQPPSTTTNATSSARTQSHVQTQAAAAARFVAAASRPTRRVRMCAVDVLPGSDEDESAVAVSAVVDSGDRRKDGTASASTARDLEQVLRLSLVDTPPLDFSAGYDALEDSLAGLLAFVEARFDESNEDVSLFRSVDLIWLPWSGS